jgi:hypothetical protein
MPCFGGCFISPGIPIDRVISLLEQIRTFFLDQAIRAFALRFSRTSSATPEYVLPNSLGATPMTVKSRCLGEVNRAVARLTRGRVGGARVLP